mmetsp:Transcript_2915/g.7616  ORF Transcript_2915/g.7616 Transcript_2915/m.7616 type:complete len:89 (-) Transcript_2915:313-579(-)
MTHTRRRIMVIRYETLESCAGAAILPLYLRKCIRKARGIGRYKLVHPNKSFHSFPERFLGTLNPKIFHQQREISRSWKIRKQQVISSS